MKSQAFYTIGLLTLCASAFSQTPVGVKPIIPRYATLPVASSKGLKALHTRMADATASGTVPMFTNSVDGYTYTMVGQDPSTALANPSITIPVVIVPVILTFPDGSIFDPSSPACSTAGVPTTMMLNSPLFSAADYTIGGTTVATGTVYTDFYQRATFWNYTNPTGTNPGYHNYLSATLGAPLNIAVPAGDGSIVTGTSGCGKIGELSLAFLDSYLQTNGLPQVPTSSIAVFEMTNVQMYDTKGNDNIIGYHSGVINGSGLQPYAVTDYDTTNAYGSTTDVASLSHELNELLADPTTTNPTPSWGDIGQVLGCQANLEVADPLTGTVNTMTLNGYAYHLQELAFLSWFFRDNPSTAVNGWYSSNNTFTGPSTPCNATTTTLSLSPTSFAVGAAVTATITVAAASGGTPTGNVSLVADNGGLGATIATFPLGPNGTVIGTTTNFPAGSYPVYVDYEGAPGFTASYSPEIPVTVGGASVTFNPISYSFGSQVLNTVGYATNIEMINDGTAPLSGISISLTGASPGDFILVSNNCGTSLAMDGSCYITVEFKPTALGLRTAYVTVADNASGSPQTVPISGTGTGTPAVTLSPASLAFGNVMKGSSGTLSVTVTNSGSGPLTLSTLGIGGANASYFTQVNNCVTSIAPGGNCLIDVTFAPTAVGNFSATLSMGDNATGSPQSVALSGSGVGAPAVSLSPASLTFSSYALGASSPALNTTLSNTGAGPLSIASIAIGGANQGDFSQTNNCGTSLAAGAKCTISVVFKPIAVGARSATVSLTDNAANSPQSVALSGTGLGAPLATLSATSLALGSVNVGSSGSGSVTLTNTGTAPLSITSIGVGGPNASLFTEANTCGTSLAATNSCTISVTFKPTAAGTFTATVSLADNAAGSPQTVTLSGTGVGVPVVSLSPASLTFASLALGSSSASQSVTLSNTGTGSLSITTLAVVGANPGDFSQTNNCGASLSAGAKCTISVVFKPTAIGARSATVSLTDNAAGSSQSVALSGTGLGAPLVSLSPTSLAFGSVNAGSSSASQTATLTNTGTAALTISSVSFSGTNASYFSQTNTCGASLPAGSACGISVTFKPTAVGAFTASLSVADNAAGSPQTVALTGTGLGAPAVSLSPASLAFGNSVVGVPAKAQAVTLTNSGTASLTVSSVVLGGTNPSDFAQTNNCVGTLAAGGKCTLNVTFDSTALGARSASVTFTDNASGSTQSVSLSGTGISPLTLSATSIAFGSVPSGGKSPNQNLTLTNAGTAPVSVASFALSDTADFAVTNNCGSSIAPGKNCTATLTFIPKSKVAFTATLTITDSALGSPQTVTLTGTGK